MRKRKQIPLKIEAIRKMRPAFFPPLPVLFCLLPVLLSLAGCSSAEPEERQVFAMDTFMTLSAYGEDKAAACDEAVSEISRLDALWSVGNQDSEITRFNRLGHTSLSADSATLLSSACAISAETDGALDITIYPLVELWGFPSGNMAVPTQESIAETLPKIGMEHLLFDGTQAVLTDGAQIDLGAIAKGYTSDRIMECFRRHDLRSAMVSLGGNVQTLGTKPDGSPWKIGIDNPDNTLPALGDVPSIGVLEVADKAVISSGDYRRFFIENGEKYHHILDPATGYPAKSGLISVTIVSDSGTLADGLSTALFVMGKDKALTYWDTHGSLAAGIASFEAILVESDGAITITDGLKDSFHSDLPYEIHSRK